MGAGAGHVPEWSLRSVRGQVVPARPCERASFWRLGGRQHQDLVRLRGESGRAAAAGKGVEAEST